MTLQDSDNMLEIMSKRFKVGDNTKKDVQSRTASIVNNSNPSEQNDSLCANMISEVVKVAAERVKSKQRMASVTNKIDEVGLL